MPVDFNANNANDLGTDVEAAIQPIANGEPFNATILKRPSENLRERTEELKRVVADNELIETFEKGAYVTSDGGNCELILKTTVAPIATEAAIPADTAYWFRPVDPAALLLDSPAVNGSNVIIRQGMFDNLYGEGTDAGADIEHALAQRGDSIAVIFPRRSETTSGPADRDAMNWYPDVDDADVTGYPAIAAGTVDHEGHLIKLPARVILTDSAGDFITDFKEGNGANTELFTAAGLIAAAEVATGIWINISKLTGDGDAFGWYTKGGRGGRWNDPGEPGRDYLQVVKVTATTVEVASTTPFRIIWPTTEANIEWNFYTFGGGAYTVAQRGAVGNAEYVNASTSAKDFTGHLLVPIVTRTKEGFVFTPEGGFLRDTSVALAGFSLPISTDDEAVTQTLAQVITFDDIDGVAAATATVDFAETLPAGTEILGVSADLYTLFDTADAQMKIGITTNDDMFFPLVQVGDVFGSLGMYQMGGRAEGHGAAAAGIPRVTFTASENFAGNTTVGAVKITIYYRTT